MDVKQNPFSLYDFLGYFTPGALFLYGLMAAYAHALPDTTGIEFITKKLAFEKAEVYVPFILVSYSMGHLLSFISSITIERYSIWALGYPSKYLLALPVDGYFCAEGNKSLRRIVRFLLG